MVKVVPCTLQDKGMLGANGIVSGTDLLLVQVFLFEIKVKRMLLYVSFDGAANEGNFHEGLNFASILNLPVIFVCENNHSVKVQHMIMPVLQKQLQSASAYNMPGVRVDGMDVVEVYKAAQEAVERKNGEGPTLIECDTYRKYGHFEGDEQKLNHQMIVMRTKTQQKTLNVKHLKKVG